MAQVRPGSVADRAGWEVGDVLVGMDKYKMVDQDAVLYVLRDTHRDAAAVKFLVARGDQIDTGHVNFDLQPALAASATVNTNQEATAPRAVAAR
ncbi:MAG: hypothetical protein U1D30_23015 [Planctomycetota bacterium]